MYLASRCFLDTRKLDTAKADGAPTPVVDQIVDALIWRSHPGNLRPYADRKRAATALAELRHPNAIPHLVSLASEELATGWGTEKRYEFSGIRLIAVNGLMLMQDAASAYVLDKRPALANVLTAWWTAYEHGELNGLIAELQRADKATSPIAAFALGFFDEDLARQTLLDVFAKDDTDRDVGWAVTDTFTLLDPTWVSTNVIEPRLQQFADPRVPYLIGWLGMATEGTRAASNTWSNASCTASPRCRRERSAHSARSEADGKRALCESVVAANWAEVRRQGMNLPAEIPEEDRNRLQIAAMESSARDRQSESIAALRTARQRGVGMTITLRQLSFDVAEDIYWRLTGGLSGESFDARKGSQSRSTPRGERAMSTHTIPGTSTEYHLIAFDADGRERTDDVAGGVFSRTVLEKVKTESPTNIFFFSHGWKGDGPAAIDQYNRWIKAMVDLSPDAQRMGTGFKPMWIGLHWPSLPWGEEGSGSFAAAGGKPLGQLFEETARALRRQRGGPRSAEGDLRRAREGPRSV